MLLCWAGASPSFITHRGLGSLTYSNVKSSFSLLFLPFLPHILRAYCVPGIGDSEYDSAGMEKYPAQQRGYLPGLLVTSVFDFVAFPHILNSTSP